MPANLSSIQRRSQDILLRCRRAQSKAEQAFQDFAATVNRPFTRAERDVLRNLIEGRTNKQIAGRMGISPATAAAHLRNLCRKAGLDGACEATLFVVQQPHATRPGAVYRRGLHLYDVACHCAHCQVRGAVA